MDNLHPLAVPDTHYSNKKYHGKYHAY